jgi:hypothetical protein
MIKQKNSDTNKRFRPLKRQIETLLEQLARLGVLI